MKKSSESEVQFKETRNCCKRVLEAVKLAYATKTKEFITSHKLGLHDFWQIAGSVLSKSKCAFPSLFNNPEVFAKNFSQKSNLDDSGISLIVFTS